MRLVRQKHDNGCVVACLAMVLNKTYDEVVEESGIDPEKGARRWQWQRMLKRHHWHGYYREYDIHKELPETWAGIHLCSYFEGGLAHEGHMVIVYQGRYVYDPLHDSLRSYRDLVAVRMLAAVYSPFLIQPRLLPKGN